MGSITSAPQVVDDTVSKISFHRVSVKPSSVNETSFIEDETGSDMSDGDWFHLMELTTPTLHDDGMLIDPSMTPVPPPPSPSTQIEDFDDGDDLGKATVFPAKGAIAILNLLLDEKCLCCH